MTITRGMNIKFRSPRRTAAECKHESSIRMEFAGMSREVCEACGRVSVGFVEPHVVDEIAQTVEGTPGSGRPEG